MNANVTNSKIIDQPVVWKLVASHSNLQDIGRLGRTDKKMNYVINTAILKNDHSTMEPFWKNQCMISLKKYAPKNFFEFAQKDKFIEGMNAEDCRLIIKQVKNNHDIKKFEKKREDQNFLQAVPHSKLHPKKRTIAKIKECLNISSKKKKPKLNEQKKSTVPEQKQEIQIKFDILMVKFEKESDPCFIKSAIETWTPLEKKRLSWISNPNIEEAFSTINLSQHSILHLACQKNDKESVERILKNPSLDINKAGKKCFRMTALHVAVLANRIDIVELLLAHPKIDVIIKDEWGKTALDHVLSSKKTDAKIIIMLQNKILKDT